MLLYSRSCLLLLLVTLVACTSAESNNQLNNNSEQETSASSSLRVARRLIDEAAVAEKEAAAKEASDEEQSTGNATRETADAEPNAADEAQKGADAAAQAAADAAQAAANLAQAVGGGADDPVKQPDITQEVDGNTGVTPATGGDESGASSLPADENQQTPPDDSQTSGGTEINVTPPEGEGDSSGVSDTSKETPQENQQETQQEIQQETPQENQQETPQENQQETTQENQQETTQEAKQVDNCVAAANCEDCLKAAQLTQSMNPANSCKWKVEEAASPCTMIQETLPAPNDMCAMAQSAAAPPPVDDMNDGEGSGSTFTIGVVVLAFVLVGAALMRFRKGSSFVGDGDDGKSTAMGDFGSILGSSAGRSTYNKSETVPLARSGADDDAEWGWEDSSTGENGGDVEMTAKKDDEDLTMAFAISQTRTPAPKASAMSRPKSSPIVSRPAPPSYSNSSAAKPSMPAMQITSLGLKKATGASLAKKKKPMKKQDDDLFASMGLAAKPTFSQLTKPPKSAPVKLPSNSLSAMDMGGDADWDDDGDLDDLLND